MHLESWCIFSLSFFVLLTVLCVYLQFFLLVISQCSRRSFYLLSLLSSLLSSFACFLFFLYWPFFQSLLLINRSSRPVLQVFEWANCIVDRLTRIHSLSWKAIFCCRRMLSFVGLFPIYLLGIFSYFIH